MQLLIHGSSYSPSVIFDLEKKLLRIDGISSMPDSRQFYQNLMDWLIAHRAHISPGSRLFIRLIYLNSGSHKALFNFFSTLAAHKMPIFVTFILSKQMDNSEEVELLVQMCKQVGVNCEVQSE
ncbi:MAG: SiaC family regulatory phosphoprotein [Bacteroidia bacterium]